MNRRLAVLAATGLLSLLTTGVLPAQRLAATVIPEHYEIHLSPDFESDTFQGEVTISVRLSQPTSSITLNAAEMEILAASVTALGETQPATAALDAAQQTVTLDVARQLPAGPATITLRYTAKLNDELRGFYLSRANGRDYAVTQLEATDARRAFPCFDEPAAKATFALTATVDSRDTAISNGRVLSDTPGPAAGKHTLKFSTTPRMSTYLVALAVGDFECIRGGADGVPIRACATPGHQAELKFALQSAEIALAYFGRYFSIKYPFEKLDLIGVPDFAAGAMENVGAIVFRERFLFANEKTSSVEELKTTSQYVAHEIAHQWFGDLVTMKWWDDVWLNEGFATWMERRPQSEWKPEWNAGLDELRDTQNAMNLDTLASTRPIRTAVETPEEINQVFDAIAYQKTAAVVRMVEAYVGVTSYRNAIRDYLKKFSYGNATGDDFWSTIATSTKKPVAGMFSSFITQPSLPLVRVSTTCDAGKTTLTLSQQPISSDVPASTTWQVPVCFKRASNGKVDAPSCEVLSQPSRTFSLEGCSSWLFANADSRGYYRSAYGSDELKALGGAVRNNQLTSVEQTSLLEDVWTLVRLNEGDIADFLLLTDEVVKTPVSPVIATAAQRINYIADHLLADAERPAFERWVRQLLKPVADKLGWTPASGENDERSEVRSAVLYTLGYAGRDPDVLREARDRIDRYLASGASIDPTVFGVAVQLAALNGDAALYERYLERARTREPRGEDGERSRTFRGALAYFIDPALRQRTLAYATSPDVRTQDAPYLISTLFGRPWAARDTWEHLKANWDALQRTGMFQGVRALVGATQNFCDETARQDVDSFFQSHRIGGNERRARQALETIARCIATKDYQSKHLSAFLNR